MKVQILGVGCPKCRQLEANTKEALRLLGMNDPVEKVTDIREIMKFGVMMTPALAINGKVALYGKVASPAEIQTAITSAL
jgi:small redox-active disulfide protein 2